MAALSSETLARLTERPQPLAEAFFRAREINQRLGIESADDLWHWIAGGASGPVNGGELELPAGPAVFYRGQSDATFNLSSALYRQCRDQGGQVTEAVLKAVESAVLEGMRHEGIGRLMSDGELLTVLQRHRIPTRLIDVSDEAPEALYFAVDGSDGVDGRLFVISLHGLADGRTDEITFTREDKRLPWHGAVFGKERAKAEWTSRVAVIKAQHLDPRMRAQRGQFLVGGLNRSYPGSDMSIGGVPVPAEHRADITTLMIHFPAQQRTSRSKYWAATGWTIRIPGEWKKTLRARLRELSPSITSDAMYPPVTEVRRLALKLALDQLR